MGYDESSGTWEPRTCVHPDLIKEYELSTGTYDYSWWFRCPTCDLPCSSNRDIVIHSVKTQGKEKSHEFVVVTLADVVVEEWKIVTQQSLRSSIVWDGKPLDNVFRSKYLGTVFTKDTYQKYDTKERISQSQSRWGQLRHVLDPRLTWPEHQTQVDIVSVGCAFHPNI